MRMGCDIGVFYVVWIEWVGCRGFGIGCSGSEKGVCSYIPYKSKLYLYNIFQTIL